MAVKNLAELAEESAERLGDRSIYEIEGERFTNWQLLDRSRRLHAALADLGQTRGGKVAVVMMNNALVFPVMQGIMRCGGTAVPVMPQSTASELRYVFADAEVQFVVTDADRLSAVREAVAGLRHVRAILVVRRRRSCRSFAARASPGEFAPDRSSHGVAADRSRGHRGHALFFWHNGPRQGRAALARQFTGRRRGGFRRGGAAHLGRTAESRSAPCPSRHIFGVAMMNDLLMTPEHLADQTLLVQLRWFDPERFMALIQQHRSTVTAAVPAILAVLLHHPRRA